VLCGKEALRIEKYRYLDLFIINGEEEIVNNG
jgi:hypothetical protein